MTTNIAKHVCKKADWCICSISALEPNDNCPLHGHPWPPKCAECGKFMPWPKVEEVCDDHE